MNNNFSLELKKALALAIYQGVDFFIHNGRVWMGEEANEREAFRQWCDAKGEGATAENWNDWLETVGEEMPEYEEDDCHIVLTDEEADERAAEYIKEALWAFNPDFLAAHCPAGVDGDAIRAIQANDRCESNNPVMLALVGDNIESLISDAIWCDGRGHFLSSYDGEETEVNLFDVTGKNEYLFVYRIN